MWSPSPPLPTPPFYQGWKEGGRGLAKSNICRRLAKSPPESCFWCGAPLHLSPMWQGRAGRGGQQDELPTPPWMGAHSRAQPAAWQMPGGSQSPPRLSWMPVLHLFVGQQACGWGCGRPLVPQEGGHLVGSIIPRGVKSCPTPLGQRLPRGTSQAVPRRRAKRARPELLKPSPELPAGCCSPPAAGSVPGRAGGEGSRWLSARLRQLTKAEGIRFPPLPVPLRGLLAALAASR